MSENIVTNQMENTSGQGKNARIPQEIRHFNWGAFFFTWIWGLLNNSYLPLISLGFCIVAMLIGFVFGIFAGVTGMPEDAFAGLLFILQLVIFVISLGINIWIGINGNVWAWQNKRWESVEHFNKIQRIWVIVFLVLMGAYIGIIVLLTISVLSFDTEKPRNRVIMLRSVNMLNQAVLINEALDKKCEMTSNGLAKCIAEGVNGNYSDNKITSKYGEEEYIFYGDGSCKSKTACYVVIKPKSSSKEEYKLHLFSEQKGIIKIDSAETEELINKFRK